jgi:Cu(I)/Ag(I) efflux system protein CusF
MEFRMNTFYFSAVTLTSALLAGGTAWAGGDHKHSHDAPKPALVAQAATEMSDGEVRKVDKEAKKITLKHGELKNLGMPGMTMVFQVKDPAMLEQVKAGDKVRFTAEKAEGGFAVTAIEPAK